MRSPVGTYDVRISFSTGVATVVSTIAANFQWPLLRRPCGPENRLAPWVVVELITSRPSAAMLSAMALAVASAPVRRSSGLQRGQRATMRRPIPATNWNKPAPGAFAHAGWRECHRLARPAHRERAGQRHHLTATPLNAWLLE